MDFRRLVACVPLAVLYGVLVVFACGRGNTLTTSGEEANPRSPQLQATEQERRALEASIPLPDPATPTTLHAYVRQRALRLAQMGTSTYESLLPEVLQGLSYDEYRSIRFRPQAALWRGSALFELQLFHPGFRYREPVRIQVVEGGQVTELFLDEMLFRYPEPVARVRDSLVPELGFAGFRVHYPLESPSRSQEVAVFLGASYFRLLGADHAYGLSARGLAVDVAEPGGEEFPVFREFWLLRPLPGQTTLTFFALLDSRSVTGAYRFDLLPGADTVLRVDVHLYARRDIVKLGVAPLTSMFLYGPNRARDFDDFRAQVHDSDGLLALTGAGEWIWRPLSNGPGLRVTSLRDRDPAGFGLFQRARRFRRLPRPTGTVSPSSKRLG